MSSTKERSRCDLDNRRTWAWRRLKTLSHSVSCTSGAEGGGDGALYATTDATGWDEAGRKSDDEGKNLSPPLMTGMVEVAAPGTRREGRGGDGGGGGLDALVVAT